LSFEKELLGLYLSEHPMANALKSVAQQANKKIAEIDQTIHLNQSFTFGGVIVSLRTVQTKSAGKSMAFGTLEDTTGKLPIVIFPRTFDQYQNLLKVDAVVVIRGRLDTREDELQCVVEKVMAPLGFEFEPVDDTPSHEITIPRNTDKETLDMLGKLLKSSPGDDKVVVLIPNGSQPERLPLPYTVGWSDQLVMEIEKLL